MEGGYRVEWLARSTERLDGNRRPENKSCRPYRSCESNCGLIAAKGRADCSATSFAVATRHKLQNLLEEPRYECVRPCTEQLEKVEAGMDSINQDMQIAEKALKGMELCCGIFPKFWKKYVFSPNCWTFFNAKIVATLFHF